MLVTGACLAYPQKAVKGAKFKGTLEGTGDITSHPKTIIEMIK